MDELMAGDTPMSGSMGQNQDAMLSELVAARKITQAQGLNPDSWVDLRQCLGMLTQEKFFSNTRHGYARGYEARAFVDSIQRYYEILTWMDTRDHPLLVTQL